MAKQRLKQLEPNKIVFSKWCFDGEEEDDWVFVTKQRIIIVLPSLPIPEHFTPEKPATSQSQAELITETHKATLVHPVTEHCTLQKTPTSQSQAKLRAEIVHTVVPSLLVPEHCTLQKPTTSQLWPELRDMVAYTYETTPEIVKGHNFTTSNSPAPRRSLQDNKTNPGTRVESSLEIHRSHTGRKHIRFPRVMCRNVVMDNEKLRVMNLERKVVKAGGLNEWVGSIGLGREFERMLRGQRMSKFQVANLTMEKLKQMGALAVGPRKKAYTWNSLCL